MKDSHKTCLSCGLMALAMVLPWLALAAGWIIGKDWKVGAEAMMITFAVLFLTAGIILATIRHPSILAASLPFAAGLVYSLIPNPIPFPIDSFAAILMGALFSFFLWWRRWPGLPKWIIGPMLLSSVYNLLGGLIPGPIDEAIAYSIILLPAGYRLWQQLDEQPPAQAIVDVEAKQEPPDSEKPEAEDLPDETP